jgi:hypothetical protein
MAWFLRQLTRIPGVRGLWTKIPLGSVDTRFQYGIWRRPHYAYGVYRAADLATRLNLPGISVIEFGVAGGRGLIELEYIAAQVSKRFGIPISVYGFDTGEGMPEPADYRDLPYVWQAGFYRMDQNLLKSKLRSARLLLGDVSKTIPELLAEKIHPIGFIAFDLDYYSSTKDAFRVFQGPEASRLPRTYCYFDDVIWPETACHNRYIGELCAIEEFNTENSAKKLAPIHRLSSMRIHASPWNYQMYVMHDFQHARYCVNITPQLETHTQIPL